jgi:hypothetical protein
VARPIQSNASTSAATFLLAKPDYRDLSSAAPLVLPCQVPLLLEFLPATFAIRSIPWGQFGHEVMVDRAGLPQLSSIGASCDSARTFILATEGAKISSVISEIESFSGKT